LILFKRAANRVGLLVSVFHQQHVVGFLEGLETSGRPSIALNHLGEVSYTTASAAKLVGDGFSIRRGIPFGTTPRSEAGFLALRQWILSRSGTLPESFVIDRLSSRYPIAAIPVAIPDNGLLALPFARVVIMLLDLSGDAELPKTLMRSMFGFTSREADVAALLARGDDAADISEGLGLRIASARQVIKSVLAKAGVRRQSELVAILARFN
jgi:DNA-binding CsgD family transcriptional regulator